MNFELLPVDETLEILKAQANPKKAFIEIIAECNIKLPSKIWNEYSSLNISVDINEAIDWLQSCINKYPKTTGVYLGLDTLNMDNGKGQNVEIGLSTSCNPKEFSDEWAYDCEVYGDSHLIKGLSDVSDSFENEDKWTSDELRFAEYMIFLAYSGIVFREALKELKLDNDLLSIWGFHDGDMFLLSQCLSGKFTLITDKDFE